jgi:hypothetical protein
MLREPVPAVAAARPGAHRELHPAPVEPSTGTSRGHCAGAGCSASRADRLSKRTWAAGVTVDAEGIAAFAALARRHGIALVLDETYGSFRDSDEPAHHLFADSGWERIVVSLHSFSKDFAIPRYPVGAVVASPELNREVCKLLDCVAVCAPRIGQEAAWAGLTGATRWRAMHFGIAR